MVTQVHRRSRVPLALAGLALALIIATLQFVIASPAESAVSGIRGWISADGTGVQGVKVDLFRANADGSRGMFLRYTHSDRGGNYSFSVSDGCYVITMIAPQGRTFTSGSKWHQRPVCVKNGSSPNRIGGRLNGGGGGGGSDSPSPTPTPTCNAGQAMWTLQFQDHFSGSGSPGSAWRQYNSAGNRNYGLRRPSAISLNNGNLNIRARMENGTLVSGGMSHTLDQTYGRYEFRVRTDRDLSEGTSGVVLTWPQSNVHPRDGENNIYETLKSPGDRSEFYTFIHEPFGTRSDQVYIPHRANASQWHTMVMEWTPNWIKIFRDGQLIRTINETSDDLIPDVAHHVAIQLDAWKHSIPGPVWMNVDYIKIWSFDGYRTC